MNPRSSSSPASRRVVWGLLILAMCSATIVEVMTPLVPAVAAQRIRAFHLAKGDWSRWVPWVVVPAMYSFSNHAELRRAPDDGVPLPESSRIKHYPGQMLGGKRLHFLEDSSVRYAVFESSYLGHTYRTVHRVDFAESTGGAEPALVVEPGEMLEIKGAEHPMEETP